MRFLQHPLACTIKDRMVELTRLPKEREPLDAPRYYLLSSTFYLMPCPLLETPSMTCSVWHCSSYDWARKPHHDANISSGAMV